MYPADETRKMRAAAHAGKFGEVIRLARTGRGLTQKDLGAACGYSQSVISRIERKGTRDVRVLQAITHHLKIVPSLLGLADHSVPSESPVKRREFLTATTATAASGVLPTNFADEPSAAVRAITMTQRRLDGITPSRDLADAALAHLRFAHRRFGSVTGLADQQAMAAAISEAAGFTAWLHWDMHDIGSARVHYDTAVQAARRAGNPTLVAYMLGSAASLALHQGDTAEGLVMLERASAQLGEDRPATAVAWLSALESVAHANGRNEKATWSALDRSLAAVEQISVQGVPPWPWVFPFDATKVAGHRLTCAVRLRQPHLAHQAAGRASPLLEGGHRKQRALLLLDVAVAHLHAQEQEAAFEVALQAVDIAAVVRSGRVTEQARRFRRQFTGSPTSELVREFDHRLSGIPA